MSLDLAGEITAITTAVLAAFAIVTGIYAVRAFRNQSQEVSDQASMLQIQSEELAEQRKVNAEQLRVLALQAAELRESLDERKRDAELRHRDQAARVFMNELREDYEDYRKDSSRIPVASLTGITSPTVHAHVTNSSDQPIYDAELRWHRGSGGYGEPNPEPLGILMPGDQTLRTRGFPMGTNLEAAGATLRFRDAAGITWIRRPDGGLTEQQ